MRTNTQLQQAIQQLDAALQVLSNDEVPAAALVYTSAADPATPPKSTAPASDTARTLMRLIVGTALLGMDELSRRAPEWEHQATLRLLAAQKTTVAPPAPAMPMLNITEQDRLLLVGWLFATQERLRATTGPARWVQGVATHMSGTVATLFDQALGTLAGDKRTRALRRDDPEVARWIALGYAEEQHCRALASVALHEITREVIGYLADEPAVQELIQTQSTSLATDALDEVRERTVSADIFVDRLVRRLLRRR